MRPSAFLGSVPSRYREVRAIEVAGDLDWLDDVDDGPQLGRDVVVEAHHDAMALRLGRKHPSPERVLGRGPPLFVEQGGQSRPRYARAPRE